MELNANLTQKKFFLKEKIKPVIKHSKAMTCCTPPETIFCECERISSEGNLEQERMERFEFLELADIGINN